MEKIKVAIIGVGGISKAHIQSYRKNPRAELYALCDINPERLEKAGKAYGISRLFSDAEEMLAALPELDAVSVCTWNSAHASCTIAALNAGKHVLCEKPMSISADEAKKMQNAARESGKLLMIGFVRRFGNDAQILKSFIDKGDFGQLYYAKAAYLRRNGNPGGWFGDSSRSGGGPLIDLGVHVIDLVRFLMGNPLPVSVYGATFSKLADRANILSEKAYVSADKSENDICDVEDLACAMIRFDNGAVLSVETSFSLNIKQNEGKIELFGTKAGAKLDPQLEIFGEWNDYMTNVTLAAPTALSFDGLFDREIDHFLSCIDEGTACCAPAEDGVILMEILDAIYESARTGHEVRLQKEVV
ncbi:MAG: Gfo/Idh/MocA family protein [Christensenellales bacterium]|jgi:predicted dehydrogenase